MDFTTLTHVIEYRKNDDAIGMVFIDPENQDRFISYKKLYRTSLQVLYNLQQAGLKQGSEVVFQVDDNEPLVYLFWACILGRMIPVPLTYAIKEDAKEKLFKVCECLNDPYLATHRGYLDQFGQGYAERIHTIQSKAVYIEDLLELSLGGLPVRSDAEDMAFIQFSSGSTGDPKGVMLTHGNLLANGYAVMKAAKFRSDDIFLSWMPLSHDMGLIGFHLNPLILGAMQYLMTPTQMMADPMLWFGKLDQYRATITSSPNFGYQYLLKKYRADRAASWDLSCLRILFNGAEPISADLCDLFLKRMSVHGLKNTTMFAVYGMAEATLAVTFPQPESEIQSICIARDKMRMGERISEVSGDHPQAMKVVCLGKALGGSPVRIVDHDDILLDDYHIGNIQTRGPNVTRGYMNRPDKTREGFTADGWLKTGDIGLMIGGRLFVTGRAKDIIFVHGTNYYAYDIEECAQRLSCVGFGCAAAAGVRKADNSEDEILLFIVYKETDLNGFIELEKQVRKAISRHMGLTIHQVLPAESIPRTTSGKPRRYQLQEAFLKGEFDDLLARVARLKEKLRPALFAAPQTHAEQRIAAVWQRLLKQEYVGLNDGFFDIGGTSLLAVELHHHLRELFECDFPLAMLYEHMTIAAMAQYLNQISQKRPTGFDPATELRANDPSRRQKFRELRRRQHHG